MVTRELIKREIDKIDENYLDLIFNLLHVFKVTSLEKNTSIIPESINVLKFYDSLAFDMKNFKFNRDEANER